MTSWLTPWYTAVRVGLGLALASEKVEGSRKRTEASMACCTARNGTCLTVGRGFEPTDGVDRFLFTLRANSRMTVGSANWNADKEIRSFQRLERYSAYEITDQRYTADPPAYEYTVQFSRS
jgi:hypothetical protein